MGRDNVGKGGRVFSNMYKGHMDKTKGGKIMGRKWVWWGLGEMVGGKWTQLYLTIKKYSKEKIYTKIQLINKP